MPPLFFPPVGVPKTQIMQIAPITGQVGRGELEPTKPQGTCEARGCSWARGARAHPPCAVGCAATSTALPRPTQHLPHCDLGFSPKAQLAKHKPSPARCVFLGSSRKRHKCRTRGRSLPSHPPPAGTESGNRRSCSTATRCSLHTASLRGDASSAPNHLGSVGARSTIPPSLFPRLTLLQYFFKKGKDVFTAFLLCFSSTPPFFFGKMDAEDSRAAPAVLETGRLHPGTVQALFECVSGAGFRSRRE